MAERKPFLLRIDKELLDAIQRWAADDLRSVNAQIEFLLREAVMRSGRGVKGANSEKGTARARLAKGKGATSD